MRSPQLPSLSKPVLPETLILTSICFVDMIWTIVAVRMGIAKESNPLLAPLIEHSSVGFAAAKMFSFLMPLTVLELLRQSRPMLIAQSLRIGLLLYIAMYTIGSLHVHGLV